MCAENTKRIDRDCLECRLISGSAVIGIALYIYYQGRRRKGLERYAMNVISSGFGLLGAARLMNIEFIKANKKQ